MKINTNRFDLNLDAEEFLAIKRALHWYADKLTNMERSRGRDDGEWDVVMYLQDRLGSQLKREAFIP
jgi:hypothetical protein